MAVRIEIGPELVTAYLGGEIDHHSAQLMRREIDHTLLVDKPPALVLDFKDVTFMDSSGIGLVMGRYRLMQELGGEVRVTNVSSHIRKVMRLSGLDKLAVLSK